MFLLTLKNLAAHKVRLAGTALAVLLGVAFMAGTLVLNDTVSSSFDTVVADANDGVDAMIRAPSPVELGYGQSGPRLDASLADAAGSVDGVAEVGYQVFGYAQLIGPDGTPVGDQSQAPAFGLNWLEDEAMNPFELVEGRAPRTDDEIVIDRATAEPTGFGPGDRATVLTAAAPRDYQVVGVATFAGQDSAAGATAVLFTTATSRQVLSPDGDVDSIVVTAEDGVSQQELVSRLSESLPHDGIEVVSGDQVVDEDQAAFAEMLGPFETLMLVFAFVAMFVGAFIINNTFSITVAQRTRDLAMLRAIGARRGQVLRTVLIEAVVVGVLASAAGVAAGIGVAHGLVALLEGFGIELPDGPTIVAGGSMALVFAVGVAVTVASAILPARRASRIAPMAALRDVAIDRSATSARRTLGGGALLALGLGALFGGLNGGELALVGLGALLTLVAVAVLAPVLARPLTGLLGRPLSLTGVAGGMATRNAQRSAKRTARTASALMIGVALVSFVTILAESFHASFAAALEDDFHGTHVVESGSFDDRGGVSHELAATLGRAPGVQLVTANRTTVATVDGGQVPMLEAFDPTVGEMFDLGTVEGDLSALGEDGIAVSADRAADHGWTIGSTIPVGLPSGEVDLEVRAIYEDATWVGGQFVGTGAFDRHLPGQLDRRIYVAGDDDAIRAAAAPYASAEVLDREGFAGNVNAEVDQMVGLLYALLGLAVVISLFGIANTLALSVHERTREIGMLRAVGMSRRQIRATIRGEAALIAVLGTVLGTGVGMVFGWAVVQTLAETMDMRLTIPVARLVVVAVLGAAAAAAAAGGPARRAARLDVLTAVSTS